MILKPNDQVRIECPVDHGEGEDTSLTTLFLIRIKDELVIIDNQAGVPLKVKRGTFFKRLERFNFKHRKAFKEFLAKTKATRTEIIGIELE